MNSSSRARVNASSLNYRPDIDGLRAVAVLSVVIYHAFPTRLPGGFIGVDVFFVISGFLISSILYSSLNKGTFSYADFYSRRIRRIFPSLLVVLAASYCAGWFLLLADEYVQLSRHITAGSLFVSNFVLMTESGYFDNSAATKPLLHLWSLAIEEQFYIVWPLLLALAFRRRRNVFAVCLAVAAASFAYSLIQTPRDQVVAFYSPLVRFWELGLGGALAYLQQRREEPTRIWAEASSIGGLGLMACGLLLLDHSQQFPGWRALLPTLAAALLIQAGPKAQLNRILLSNKVMVWVGLISYPLYLWHWPALAFARVVYSKPPEPIVRVAIVVLSIALAYLTYHFIEKPIRFGKKRIKPASLTAGLMVAGCVGLVTFARDGIETRAAVKQSLSAEAAAQFVGPLWKYTQNEACLRRFPLAAAESYSWWFCSLSRDENPTLLLLGNSYANQLYPGIAHNERLARHTVLSIGTCDPAAAVNTELRLDLQNPCSSEHLREQKEFIDGLLERTPSIRFVLIDGLNDRPDAGYIERLRERIDAIESRGTRVIVFVPHLKLPYDIRGCFPRPLMSVKFDCKVSLSERQALQASFRPLVEALRTTNPNVLVFDQNDVFCDREACSMIVDGMPLLRDESQHLSEFGSNLVAELFVGWAEKQIPELLESSGSGTEGGRGVQPSG